MDSICNKWIVAWVGLLVIAAAGLHPIPADAGDNGRRAVPDVLIHADSSDPNERGGSGTPLVVVVDKLRQRINLYEFRDYWRKLNRWPCSTGKNSGPKQLEGDQKTPEGIFFVVRDVGERYLTPVYGTRALPLDYPSWLDRFQNRNGSAIWLHGTNKSLQPFDSNGCVVLENQTIDRLAGHIRVNHTPIVIVDRVRLRAAKKMQPVARQILDAMDLWHRALMYGDYASFSHWYQAGHKPSMRRWQRWCRQRRKHGSGEDFRSVMARRLILKHGRVYVMLFDHLLMNDHLQVPAGRRKLYLTINGDDVRIMGETYQPASGRGRDPLLLAWRMLWRGTVEPRKLASGKPGEPGS